MKRRKASTESTLNMYQKTLSYSCPTVLQWHSLCKEILEIAHISDVYQTRKSCVISVGAGS